MVKIKDLQDKIKELREQLDEADDKNQTHRRTKLIQEIQKLEKELDKKRKGRKVLSVTRSIRFDAEVLAEADDRGVDVNEVCREALNNALKRVGR